MHAAVSATDNAARSQEEGMALQKDNQAAEEMQELEAHPRREVPVPPCTMTSISKTLNDDLLCSHAHRPTVRLTRWNERHNQLQ